MDEVANSLTMRSWMAEESQLVKTSSMETSTLATMSPYHAVEQVNSSSTTLPKYGPQRLWIAVSVASTLMLAFLTLMHAGIIRFST